MGGGHFGQIRLSWQNLDWIWEEDLVVRSVLSGDIYHTSTYLSRGSGCNILVALLL